jgi:hypothetical protein
MRPAEDNPTPVAPPADVKDAVTGLPWLGTWRGVYIFVFGCFLLWVALLLALTVIFS